MPAIRTDDQIRANAQSISARSAHHDACHALTIADQVHSLVRHPEIEGRKPARRSGEKVQEIPLRYKSDEFRVRRNTPKIRPLKDEVSECAAGSVNLLMWQP